MKQYSKIINGKTVVKAANRIVVQTDDAQIFNPTEEMILADGWVEYVEQPITRTKSRIQVVQELVVKQFNDRTDITNEEALDYAVIVYPWERHIGKELAVGKVVSHDNKLWRVRQTHTALYAPSLDTAALWEVIDKEHEGTADDPIPYAPPMEILEGKHYIDNGVVYFCTRGSGTALTHSLADLVGIYVELYA